MEEKDIVYYEVDENKKSRKIIRILDIISVLFGVIIIGILVLNYRIYQGMEGSYIFLIIVSIYVLNPIVCVLIRNALLYHGYKISLQ